MVDHAQRAAWMQASLLIASIAVLVIVLVIRLQRPFDRDTLAIQVEELQSQSAEAALLARNAMGDRLAPGFVRQHVQQLDDAGGRVWESLHSKPASPDLTAALARAQQLASTLHAILNPWSTDAARAAQSIVPLDDLAQRLAALDHQLKPAD